MDKGTQEKVASRLFSDEQRQNIMRSFIEGYIRGSVNVNFPTREEFQRDPDLLAAYVKFYELDTKATPIQVESVVKEAFANEIGIASGAIEARPEEVTQAMGNLFTDILRFRNAGRLKGEFFQVSDFESKIKSLEDRVSNIEQLLEELQNLIRIRGQQP